MARFYLVGGAVRDELLGLKSKDMDYTVEAESYQEMIEAIKARGGEIFLERPEFLTVRARVPEFGAADFVLARKDGFYSDGRRPDSVQMGTLKDDLLRRDFTINAIAKDEDGNYIDLFFGFNDLQDKIIRCVGKAEDRFAEDSLRMVRALRFSVTKNFIIGRDIKVCLRNEGMVNTLDNVSIERIREEMFKMFQFSTLQSLKKLEEYPLMRDKLFKNSELWLKPSLEKN